MTCLFLKVLQPKAPRAHSLFGTCSGREKVCYLFRGGSRGRLNKATVLQRTCRLGFHCDLGESKGGGAHSQGGAGYDWGK